MWKCLYVKKYPHILIISPVVRSKVPKPALLKGNPVLHVAFEGADEMLTPLLESGGQKLQVFEIETRCVLMHVNTGAYTELLHLKCLIVVHWPNLDICWQMNLKKGKSDSIYEVCVFVHITMWRQQLTAHQLMGISWKLQDHLKGRKGFLKVKTCFHG